MQKDAEASAAAFKKEQEAAAAAFSAMQDKAVATGKITAAEADKRSKEFQKHQASDSATFSKLQKEQMAIADKKAKEESKAGKEREQLAKKATDGLSKMRNEILGIATALLGVAGIKSFGEHLINSSAELGRTSDLLGINAEKLTAWQAAAEKTGTSIESVRGAFAAFNKLKQQLQTGDSAGIESINAYARAMAGVGKGGVVASDILADKNVSSEEKLLEIAKETEGLSVKDRALVLSKLNLSEDMALVLAQGRDALAASVAHFASLHPDLEKAQEESRGLKAEWVEFKETISGASETILVMLKPALDLAMSVMKSIEEWAKSHPKIFAGVFAGLLATITAITVAVGLMTAAMVFGPAIAAIGTVATAMIGVSLAIGEVLAALGLLIAAWKAGEAAAEWLDKKFGLKNYDKQGNDLRSKKSTDNRTPEQAAAQLKSLEDQNAAILNGGTGTAVSPVDIKPNIKPKLAGTKKDIEPKLAGTKKDIEPKLAGIKKDIEQLESLEWTHEQASGIVANLQRESSGNEKEIGDNGKAYGLAQWHPDRQANFAKFAGKDIRESSHAEQIAFVNYELRKGSEQNAGRQLGGAASASDAAAIISKSYERPKDKEKEAQERSSIAESLAKLSSGAAVDRSLSVGSQAAVANTQSNNINNQALNNNQVETHIGAVHINAPNAKTNGDVATAMTDKLQSYSFASMANMGLA